jgi:hypothetical protein
VLRLLKPSGIFKALKKSITLHATVLTKVLLVHEGPVKAGHLHCKVTMLLNYSWRLLKNAQMKKIAVLKNKKRRR